MMDHVSMLPNMAGPTGSHGTAGMSVNLAAIWERLRTSPELLGQSAPLVPTGASMDNRETASGHIFFCIKGERVDGHDFARDAVRAGAIAVIGERDPFGGRAPVPFLRVANTVRALGEVAALHREHASATVVAVTGTAGKTSIKECLAAILASHGKTARNPRNLNNQIGLPLSMCNAAADAKWWVMEAGISRDGDMDDLGAILHPDVALILNAADGHLEGLGERGVAWHKARLLDWLREDGTGVVSADYPELLAECRERDVDLVYFSAGTAGICAGQKAGCKKHGCHKTGLPVVAGATYLGPVAARDGSLGESGRFAVSCATELAEVAAPFQGSYGAENVAALAAVCHCLGLGLSQLSEGLAHCPASGLRFRQENTGLGLVIDDSYNANPLSMTRMVEAAATLAEKRGEPLALILGEMGELGCQADDLHRELGRAIAHFAVHAVLWKGGWIEAVRDGLREGGYTGTVLPVDGVEDIAPALEQARFSHGVILVKGSRSNRLELYVEELKRMTPTRNSNAL